MARFDECPNCGNEDHQASIFYCKDCETYFCDDCVGDKAGAGGHALSEFGWSSFCPDCSDGGYIGKVGVIWKDDEGSDDDDPEDDDED